MAGSQLTLDQALARVVDQYKMLKYLFEVNPEHVLELPADKVLLDMLKATARHVPKNDPVAEILELFIMEAQNRTPVFKVSQLLPLIMAVQGALQDKVNKRDTRKLKRGDSGRGNAAQKSPSHHLQSPPSLPQYRSERLIDRRNEPGRYSLGS